MKKLFAVVLVVVVAALAYQTLDAVAAACAKGIAQAVVIPFRVAGLPVR